MILFVINIGHVALLGGLESKDIESLGLRDTPVSSVEYSITADRDSYTDEQNPTVNYGNEDDLKAGMRDIQFSTLETYIHFSFGAISQGWTNTIIRIYVYKHTFIQEYFNIWEVSNNWEESEISWANSPNKKQLITGFSMNIIGSYIEIDINDLVECKSEISICITDVGPYPDWVNIRSRESTYTYRPKIIWDSIYQEPIEKEEFYTISDKDCYVYENTPTTNYGDEQALVTGFDTIVGWHYKYETFIHFDFKEKGFCWNKTKGDKAIIKLYIQYVPENMHLSMWVVPNEWDENDVNWNTRPSKQHKICNFFVDHVGEINIDITDEITSAQNTEISICINAFNDDIYNLIAITSKEGVNPENRRPTLIWRDYDSESMIEILSEPEIFNCADRDSYVYEFNPTRNYGEETALASGVDHITEYNYESFIHFNFSNKPVTWNSSEGDTAFIRLYFHIVPEIIQISVWFSYDDWTENNINWNNKPTTPYKIIDVIIREKGDVEIEITNEIVGGSGISVCVKTLNDFIGMKSKEYPILSCDPMLIWREEIPSENGDDPKIINVGDDNDDSSDKNITIISGYNVLILLGFMVGITVVIIGVLKRSGIKKQ